MEARNEKVFVDSNYFIALFDETNTQFLKADRISKELKEREHSLCISNLVFLEVVTIVSMRSSRTIAQEVGKYLRSHSKIHITHIDEDLHEAAWNIFQETEHKNISFVDCSIIAAMKAEGILKLLTFDKKDFKQLQKNYRFSFYE
jgi:predicted nucleic acid-binding protein